MWMNLWTKARLEVLSMVVNLLVLAALDFSLVVKAIQTMIHSDHSGAVHHPIFVFILTAVGLFVNVLCILLIGGAHLNELSFMSITRVMRVCIFLGNYCLPIRIYSSPRKFPSTDTWRRRRHSRNGFRGRCSFRIATIDLSGKTQGRKQGSVQCGSWQSIRSEMADSSVRFSRHCKYCIIDDWFHFQFLINFFFF